MLRLIIRYSEAYDAQIAGWTGALDQDYFENRYDEWEANYVLTGRQFAADCQQVWNQINDTVFAALRAFGYQFVDE